MGLRFDSCKEMLVIFSSLFSGYITMWINVYVNCFVSEDSYIYLHECNYSFSKVFWLSKLTYPHVGIWFHMTLTLYSCIPE